MYRRYITTNLILYIIYLCVYFIILLSFLYYLVYLCICLEWYTLMCTQVVACRMLSTFVFFTTTCT
jgi:hypothetical protein